MSDSQTNVAVSDEQPTWTEPPWSGWIETTGDALLILEAARRGLIPRVTRRLVESERKMITSGSVFVFDEDESGIKRWTDGFFWSPSRILGNFLLYRETEKRGASLRGSKSTDNAGDGNDNGLDIRSEGTSLSRPKGEPTGFGIDRARERVLVGSLTNSYKFKAGGMVKKTFSLSINGVAQHLISYYKVEDVQQGRLRSPSSLPEIASLDISPEYLDKQHFRLPPKIEICIDGVPRYRGEADDIDHSVDTLGSPLSSGLPLITDGRIPVEGESGKRMKRSGYDLYSSGPGKRGRKPKKNAPSSSAEQPSPMEQQPQPSPSSPSVPVSSSPPQPQSQQQVQSPQPQSPYLYGVPVQPPQGYPDPSLSAGPPHFAAYGVPPHYHSMPGYPLPVYPGSAPSQNTATPVPPQNQGSPPAPPTPSQQYGYSNYPADLSQQMYPYYPPWPAYGGYAGMWAYPGYPTPGVPPHTVLSGPDVPNQTPGVVDEAAGVAAIHT